MSVIIETSQPAMEPYVAVAASGLALYACTAVCREALVVKVFWIVQETSGLGDGGGGDGDGLGGGGEGEGGEGLGGGEGEGGEGLSGGGDGEGGEELSEGPCVTVKSFTLNVFCPLYAHTLT